ncbi:MAG: hypothetical protein AB1755_05210 [Candidatus Omnitrophota bacterium]
MKWEEFVKLTDNLPVIDSEMLLVGVVNPSSVKVQLDRWRKSGKLIQIRRGIYILAKPYRKLDIYEPYLASIVKSPSYVSLEKALEFHNLIPEAVSIYTCITTKRPYKFVSKLGIFDYRHIKQSLFWGYESVTVNKQTGFIACPEKALLDFFYLREVKVSFDYIEELRLENLEKINLEKLFVFAKRFNKPGILRDAKMIKEYIELEIKKEKLL